MSLVTPPNSNGWTIPFIQWSKDHSQVMKVFYLYKIYYVGSLAWSYFGFMHWVFTLYHKNYNKNKKIQSDSITMENIIEIIIIKTNTKFNWFSRITFKPFQKISPQKGGGGEGYLHPACNNSGMVTNCHTVDNRTTAQLFNCTWKHIYSTLVTISLVAIRSWQRRATVNGYWQLAETIRWCD
jgi:hypothetical protein